MQRDWPVSGHMIGCNLQELLASALHTQHDAAWSVKITKPAAFSVVNTCVSLKLPAFLSLLMKRDTFHKLNHNNAGLHARTAIGLACRHIFRLSAAATTQAPAHHG